MVELADQLAQRAQAFTTTSPPIIQNMSKPRSASRDCNRPAVGAAAAWSFMPITLPLGANCATSAPLADLRQTIAHILQSLGNITNASFLVADLALDAQRTTEAD